MNVPVRMETGMTGLYAETCVKKRMTIGTFMAELGLIFAVVVIFIFSFILGSVSMVGYVAMLVASALFIGLFYILPRFNIEYEYIFVDGQLDFDLIMGGNKRKRGLRIDFENVEVMAPERSHELDSYNRQQFVLKDYSSRDKESPDRYVIFYRLGEKLTKIVFEPNDKILGCIKQKSPRKLVEY